jgi:hypothetical protein
VAARAEAAKAALARGEVSGYGSGDRGGGGAGKAKKGVRKMEDDCLLLFATLPDTACCLVVDQRPEACNCAAAGHRISIDRVHARSVRHKEGFDAGHFRWVRSAAAMLCDRCCAAKLQQLTSVRLFCSEFEMVKQFVNRNKLVAKSIVQDDKVVSYRCFFV